MDIEIVVIGESSKWVLSHPRIRIGQDPRCEVSLPPGRYPAVSGEHVALDMVNGAVFLVKGERSGGETFLNGHPASNGATVRSGDILRLGAGGPELRIRLLEREAYAPTAEYEPTRILDQPAPPTRVIHEPTRIVTGPVATSYSSAPPHAAGTAERQSYSAQSAPVAYAPPPPAADASEDLRRLEGKLKTMHGILLANLVILLLLLAGLAWQQQELSQNRDELQQLRAQTNNAVSQFTPALDAKLSGFESRIDGMNAQISAAQDRMVKGMDAQTQRAEDRMVDRMNTAIPAMLDQYIAKKFAVLKH
jgi:hypothetical protein